MLECFYCQRSARDVILLRIHLQMAHSGVWKRPYLCGLQNCLRTFQSTFNWKRHVEEHHNKCSEFCGKPEILLDDSVADIDWSSDTTRPPSPPSVSVEDLKESIKQSAIDFVLNLRSSSSVTISTCEKAVQVCTTVEICVPGFSEYKNHRIEDPLYFDLFRIFSEAKKLFSEYKTPLLYSE
jgi:hypothetical protein